MATDPVTRGRRAAALFFRAAPGLFRDLEESGCLAVADARARREWDAFALYACVRALVAGGGFTPDSGRAVDALHEAVTAEWRAAGADEVQLARRRAELAERYAEYGSLGQRESRGGDPKVARALGLAAARRMTGGEAPDEALAELAGRLHEELLEGVGAALEREGA